MADQDLSQYGSVSDATPDLSQYGTVSDSGQNHSVLSDVGDTIKQYWDKVNPVTQAQGITAPLTQSPKKTIGDYSQQQQGLLDEASKSFKNGQYSEGVRHGLMYMLNGVPGFGAALDEAGNKAGKGDYRGAVADTAALATYILEGKWLHAGTEAATEPGAASKAVSSVTEPVKAATNTVKNTATAIKTGVKAAAPDIAGGAAQVGAGAVIGDALPGEAAWIPRIGLGYPGMRQVVGGLRKGINAARDSFAENSKTASVDPYEPTTQDLDGAAKYLYQTTYDKLPTTSRSGVNPQKVVYDLIRKDNMRRAGAIEPTQTTTPGASTKATQPSEATPTIPEAPSSGKSLRQMLDDELAAAKPGQQPFVPGEQHPFDEVPLTTPAMRAATGEIPQVPGPQTITPMLGDDSLVTPQMRAAVSEIPRPTTAPKPKASPVTPEPQQPASPEPEVSTEPETPPIGNPKSGQDQTPEIPKGKTLADYGINLGEPPSHLSETGYPQEYRDLLTKHLGTKDANGKSLVPAPESSIAAEKSHAENLASGKTPITRERWDSLTTAQKNNLLRTSNVVRASRGEIVNKTANRATWDESPRSQASLERIGSLLPHEPPPKLPPQVVQDAINKSKTNK